MKTDLTPCFPQFIRFVAAMGRRTPAKMCETPTDVEQLFGKYLPNGTPDFREDNVARRKRKYPLRLVFWSLIWQMLKPKTSCREVVRHIQALHETETLRYDGSTSAYCQAKNRLPERVLRKALYDTATTAEQLSYAAIPGWDRRILILDGTSVSLADTPANREVYPYAPAQKPGCGFPSMKVLAAGSLASGAIHRYQETHEHTHDHRMLMGNLDFFRLGDIALADRAFCSFVSMAALRLRGVDAVYRLHKQRRPGNKTARKISPSEWIDTWTRPKRKPAYVEPDEWEALPESMQVRIILVQLHQKGFRTQTVWIVTTLLDPAAYPTERIIELHRMRWNIELCLRDLKTTMGMEELRGRTPAMVRKELLAYLIAHNFIRCLEAEAAARHGVSRHRISFKGTMDTARNFLGIIFHTRSKRKIQEIRIRLLEIIACDIVPNRPGRREPRALKRRPKTYPLLTQPRRTFQDPPHRKKRRTKKGKCLS